MVAKRILNLPSRLPGVWADHRLNLQRDLVLFPVPISGVMLLMSGIVSVFRPLNAFWFCTLLCNRCRTHWHMASCWLKLFGKSGTGLCQLNHGFKPNCWPEPPSLLQIFNPGLSGYMSQENLGCWGKDPAPSSGLLTHTPFRKTEHSSCRRSQNP